jgi:hypothetical protein
MFFEFPVARSCAGSASSFSRSEIFTITFLTIPAKFSVGYGPMVDSHSERKQLNFRSYGREESLVSLK